MGDQHDNRIGNRIVQFGPCCLCGKEIEPTQIDPCNVEVSTAMGAWQVWRCHAECFKARLAQDTLVDVSPAHF
jgi:hypothetical protein